jgi:hypothetical protein
VQDELPGVQDELPGVEVQDEIPGVELQDEIPGVRGELTGVPPQENVNTTSDTTGGQSDLT